MLQNGTVVEVHKSEHNSGLWYHVARIVNVGDSEDCVWGPSISYDNGVDPCVAIMENGTVVEVHQSEYNPPRLWYHVGRLQPDDTIKWGPSTQYDDGESPSVAVLDDGTVIEVHKSQRYDTLWYHVGQVQPDDTIAWGMSVGYGNGVKPVAASTESGVVIEVHTGEDHNALYYQVGRLAENNNIDWFHPATRFDEGTYPSVACNNRLCLETHNGYGKKTQLWTSSFENCCLVMDDNSIQNVVEETHRLYKREDSDISELREGSKLYKLFSALVAQWNYDSLDPIDKPKKTLFTLAQGGTTYRIDYQGKTTDGEANIQVQMGELTYACIIMPFKTVLGKHFIRSKMYLSSRERRKIRLTLGRTKSQATIALATIIFIGLLFL